MVCTNEGTFNSRRIISKNNHLGILLSIDSQNSRPVNFPSFLFSSGHHVGLANSGNSKTRGLIGRNKTISSSYNWEELSIKPERV